MRLRHLVPAPVALLLVPAIALAAPGEPAKPSIREDNGGISFTDASPATAQRLALIRTSQGGRRQISVTDTGVPGLQVAGDCRATSDPRVATCPEPAEGRVRLTLLGLDDVVTAPTIRLPFTAAGGEGNDVIRTGTGDDDLDGGPGDDTLDGGEGADNFRGGPGIDIADFSSRPAGSVVRVTLGDDEVDGNLDDLLDQIIDKVDVKKLTASASQITLGGQPAAPAPARTGDDVRGDVENVIGGAGGDDLVGNDAANVLAGGPGADTLEGKAGSDLLDGGDGGDLLVSRDGAVDSVICGPGVDRVVSDPQDALAADCETVENGAAPGERPGGGVPGRAPEAEIVTRVVQVSRAGVAKLRVRCVYKAQRCRGPVRLLARAAAQVRVGRRTVRVRAGQVLASANVDIPWGNSQAVTLRVGVGARQVLARRARGLRARATARLTDSSAGAGSPAADIRRNVTALALKR